MDLKIERLVHKQIISGKQYLGPEDEDDQELELYIFECSIVGGKLTKGREELDVGWFTKQEAQNLPLRWPWIPELFDKK